jgi:HAD superfamily hydrolase (TIGR01509 family)
MQSSTKCDIYIQGEIMNIQLCILSAEGILLDTNKSLIQSWQTAAKLHGVTIPEGFFENILSAGIDHRQKVFYQYPHLAQLEASVLINHRKQPEQINSQLTELLDFLKDNKIKIAIVSDRPRQIIFPKIESLCKNYDINVLVCANEVLVGKPDPNVYLKAAKLSNVKSGNTLVIDDSRNGCYAAHLAFMRSIFYQHSLPLSERLFKYSYRQINQLTEITDIIRQENDPKVISDCRQSKSAVFLCLCTKAAMVK